MKPIVYNIFCTVRKQMQCCINYYFHKGTFRTLKYNPAANKISFVILVACNNSQPTARFYCTKILQIIINI